MERSRLKWYLASAAPLTVLYLWLPVEDAKLYVWPSGRDRAGAIDATIIAASLGLISRLPSGPGLPVRQADGRR